MSIHTHMAAKVERMRSLAGQYARVRKAFGGYEADFCADNESWNMEMMRHERLLGEYLDASKTARDGADKRSALGWIPGGLVPESGWYRFPGGGNGGIYVEGCTIRVADALRERLGFRKWRS